MIDLEFEIIIVSVLLGVIVFIGILFFLKDVVIFPLIKYSGFPDVYHQILNDELIINVRHLEHIITYKELVFEYDGIGNFILTKGNYVNRKNENKWMYYIPGFAIVLIIGIYRGCNDPVVCINFWIFCFVGVIAAIFIAKKIDEYKAKSYIKRHLTELKLEYNTRNIV